MADKDFTAQEGNTTPKPRTRRKSAMNLKVVANIVHITPERRKAFADHEWHEATKVFILSLSDHEKDICRKAMLLVQNVPVRRERLYDCKVITFPIQNKILSV
jgi:hypothetical protein